MLPVAVSVVGVDDGDVGVIFVGGVDAVGSWAWAVTGGEGHHGCREHEPAGVGQGLRPFVRSRCAEGSISPSWSSRSTGSVPGM